MKRASIVLSCVLAILVAFGIFFYVAGGLSAAPGIISADAADYPEAFSSIANLLSSGAAQQRFSDELPEDPAGYSLIDITISLTNRGLFDAEWLDIKLVPAAGDIAVYSLTGEGTDIAARSGGQINLKLITRAAPDAGRSVTLQYYVYGIPRSVTVRL